MGEQSSCCSAPAEHSRGGTPFPLATRWALQAATWASALTEVEPHGVIAALRTHTGCSAWLQPRLWGQDEWGRVGSAPPPAAAIPTCELRAEHLRVVDDVLPELLKLRDPRHILQEPHEVAADHEAVHELGRGGEEKHHVECSPAGGGGGENTQSFRLRPAADDSPCAQRAHPSPWHGAPSLKPAGWERRADRREGQRLF